MFDALKGVEREALLWLVRHIAPKGSYLECVVKQDGVVADNFRSAYITGAAEYPDKAGEFADERRNAIQEADVNMSDAGIRQFIARCTGESTACVAPWLNCGTDAERGELLVAARWTVLLTTVKDVYPETAAYLHTDLVFGDIKTGISLQQHRELKMADVTPEFYEGSTSDPSEFGSIARCDGAAVCSRQLMRVTGSRCNGKRGVAANVGNAGAATEYGRFGSRARLSCQQLQDSIVCIGQTQSDGCRILSALTTLHIMVRRCTRRGRRRKTLQKLWM